MSEKVTAEVLVTVLRCEGDSDSDCNECYYGHKCDRIIQMRDAADAIESLQSELALAALREKAERENPKPLTLDELRKINAGWVWVVDKNKDAPYSGWALVSGTQILYLWVDAEEDHVGLCRKDVEEPYYQDYYGEEWIAYRTKPLPGGEEQ